MIAWLKRMASWLLKPGLLWIPILILFVAKPWACPVFRSSEQTMRLVGLSFQFLGVLTVVQDIVETRKRFNLPPLRTLPLRWLRESGLGKITGHLDVQLGEMTVTGRGTVRDQAGPNATLKERVRVLESNFQMLDRRVDELQTQSDQANRERIEALATESQTRKRDVDDLGKKLEEAETGGLERALMGLIWLIVGLVMSTASPELVSWVDLCR